MVDRRNEVLGGPKSKRAMADGLDLVVHAFDSPIGDSNVGPGEDAAEMALQHLREFLEGLQFRPDGRVNPLGEVLLSSPRLLVGPEQLEGLLQIRLVAEKCN